MTAKLSPMQIKRRQQIARLKASLIVPQYTSIKTSQASKQQPATGKFASV